MRSATYVGARQDKGAQDEAQVAKQLGGDKETTNSGQEHQSAVRHSREAAEMLIDLVHGGAQKNSIVQHTMLLRAMLGRALRGKKGSVQSSDSAGDGR